ncbi:MAG TPA: TrkH family potassium uptake protein [Planctomycetota bacterium]|nr:TrkH family potassium uptake protein [Planctomycetota bacterium]
MNLRAVGWLLGCVLLLLASFLLVPAVVALFHGENVVARACSLSALTCVIGGGLLVLLNRGSTLNAEGRLDYFRREGLAVVGLTWLLAGVGGALPYLFSGYLTSPVDAFFEAASGFTTTGSTILRPEQIDGLPKGLSFWRSFTHWLGGIGIVMVFVVLFPTGGRSLFRSEVPGIAREASRQRVRDSALALVRIYVGLTAAQVVLLRLSGIDWFDAVLHAFATLATGGFSSHSSSIAYFGSWVVELIMIVFMFAAGLNFAIYDATLRLGPRSAWRLALGSSEIRWYAGIAAGSTAAIALALWLWGGSNGDAAVPLPDYSSFLLSLRDAAFNVVSIQTSTGFGTADFDRWPQFCRVLLMILAVIGACAGSTGGGIKIVRFLIVGRAALRGLRQFARPRAINVVRMDGETLDEGVVASVTGYFALWVLVLLGGTLALCLLGLEPVGSMTAVLATLNNIGPGLAGVGPYMNFAELPAVGKVLLSVLMILGRLEFYAMAVLLLPDFWRR